jgi:hypothetical protein
VLRDGRSYPQVHVHIRLEVRASSSPCIRTHVNCERTTHTLARPCLIADLQSKINRAGESDSPHLTFLNLHSSQLSDQSTIRIHNDKEMTYDMAITRFLFFAPFCWLSVALSSDSDVPAEAAGTDDMIGRVCENHRHPQGGLRSRLRLPRMPLLH